jgi:hypothetical protein
MATATSQTNPVTVTVTIDTNGMPHVSPDPIHVLPGQDILWSCTTTGEMCLAFANSGAPCAFEYIEGSSVPFNLGPYPIVPLVPGFPSMSFKYTIGWRKDSTHTWVFTDPIVIVDTPTGGNG